MNKIFSSPASFRQSLEVRLQTFSKEKGMDLERVRRKVAFERFLARLFLTKPYPWLLKGGYALETRLEVARATKDLDLGLQLKMKGTVDEQRAFLLEKLQKSAVYAMEDHFHFRIEPAAKLIESAPYGGFRFPIRSLLAGRLFVAFSLDVGFGDAMTPPTEEIEGSNWLDFCGISPAKFEAISLEQQFAEKIHAMVVDRGGRENSRVKDLVDALLLIERGLNSTHVSLCLKNTFHRRGEPGVPRQLLHPPISWRQSFGQMAHECGLKHDFDSGVNALSIYWSTLQGRD